MGTQNRFQEAPRGDKKRHRRSPGHLRQQEASKRGPREFQDESGGPLWSIQRPEGAPKRPPRAPKRSSREPQNAFKTIFGSKTLIFQKCKDSHSQINIFEGWRVSLGAQNRPQEAPRGDKTSQRRPQNLPKATFGSKKQANEAQENSKTNLETFFGRSRGPTELPRDPQETPKSSQKEPERAPKRFQNHLWIENDDFSKIELPLS